MNNMKTNIAVVTVSGKAYYLILRELKKRKIPFLSLTPKDSIPFNIKVVITTDADLDGIHIKGLLLNFFETFWPELLKLNFIYEFITPILKAKKGKSTKSFYTIKDYEKWLKTNPKGWTIKYRPW